jgi:CHAT domain-containing protein
VGTRARQRFLTSLRFAVVIVAAFAGAACAQVQALATTSAEQPAGRSGAPQLPPALAPGAPANPNSGGPEGSSGLDRAIEEERRTGQRLFDEGHWAEAVPHARHALALAEQVRKADDPQTLELSEDLARILRFVGAYGEARELLGPVLEVREKTLGADDPRLARSLFEAGQTYHFAAEPAQAEPLLRRALAIRKKILDPNALEIAETLNALGGALTRLGRASEALPLHQRAVAIAQDAQGPEGAETFQALAGLAQVQGALGHPAEARQLFERVRSIAEKRFGPDHPWTGGALLALAGQYENIGRNDEAIDLAQRALAIEGRAVGPDSTPTANALVGLSSAFANVGRYDEAIPLLERSLAICVGLIGADNGGCAGRMTQIALFEAKSGNGDLALPLAQRAYALTESKYGPDSPMTISMLGNLAIVNTNLGEYGTALKLERQALAGREKIFGPEHPATALGLCNLAIVYARLGDVGRALPLLRRALAIRERALGPEHLMTAVSLTLLAEGLAIQRQYAEALPLQRRALQIAEKQRPNHPQLAEALGSLARLLEEKGQPQQALPLYERSLAILQAAFGPDHPQVAGRLSTLAALHKRLGQPERALPLYQDALRILLASPFPMALAEVQLGLGNYYRERRLSGAAIFYLKLAVNTAQQLRASAIEADQSLQQSLLSHLEGRYQKLADSLMAQGRYAEAEQIIAMMKEKEYFDFIHGNRREDPRVTRASFFGVEADLARRYEDLGQRLTALRRQAAHLRTLVQPDAADEERLRALDAELAAVNRELDAWMKEVARIPGSDPSPQAEAERGAALGMGATQTTLQKLGRDVALAHYIVFKDQVRILLITPGRPTQGWVVQDRLTGKPIGAAALNAKIVRYRQVLEDANKDPNLALAGELYELLVGPIEKTLQEQGTRTLMLSLDGKLRYLPFGALYDGKQYLVERLRLPLYTDAQVNGLAIAPARSEWRVWALGLAKKWCSEGQQTCPDVVPPPLTNAQAELVGVACDQGDSGPAAQALTPLPGALDCRNEDAGGFAQKGAKVFNVGQAFLDDDFTEERIKEGMARNFNVLHITTHFFLKGVDDSMLLLGNVQQLSLKEIRDNLRFDGVDLLTLSACQTGLGKGEGSSGQEVESLGVLVQKRGAGATIATLWEVYDASAPTLMRNFYRFHAQQKISKAEALRLAQLSLLHGQGELAQFRHPAHWAPFVLMGNWL